MQMTQGAAVMTMLMLAPIDKGKRSPAVPVTPPYLPFFGLAPGVTGAHGQAREELRRDEYGAFAVVCKAELAAIGDLGTQPVCVRVPPTKAPPNALLAYLRAAQVPVSPQGVCYPRHQVPHGIEISVEEIRRLPGPVVQFKVSTTNLKPLPGEHLIVPLRLGTYRLTRSDNGDWVVERYKAE